MGWTAGVWFSEGQEIFLYSRESRPTPEPTQPPIQWVPGALFLGVKRLGREADHSPPSNAEVKNGEAIPPLPPHLHGFVLNSLSRGTIVPYVSMTTSTLANCLPHTSISMRWNGRNNITLVTGNIDCYIRYALSILQYSLFKTRSEEWPLSMDEMARQLPRPTTVYCGNWKHYTIFRGFWPLLLEIWCLMCLIK
jgi:hypothetical protein